LIEKSPNSPRTASGSTFFVESTAKLAFAVDVDNEFVIDIDIIIYISRTNSKDSFSITIFKLILENITKD